MFWEIFLKTEHTGHGKLKKHTHYKKNIHAPQVQHYPTLSCYTCTHTHTHTHTNNITNALSPARTPTYTHTHTHTHTNVQTQIHTKLCIHKIAYQSFISFPTFRNLKRNEQSLFMLELLSTASEQPVFPSTKGVDGHSIRPYLQKMTGARRAREKRRMKYTDIECFWGALFKL